ncbi:NAD(P)H:quinone oxidoreductase, type IV [Basidiobolus meristosporus CBS 931.73]|uniref:NAD(P)H:quinone oxidoreductase, type IV n=1 Tax=Basidiobolus meristosporus CBS 931.73 TaxID=1314790 RepID=A0A1Y1Y922_9FUNG|nr:NAD(P)H:quinone oxidoreductase, type IV [Basidiobolus meristosporus CBS 931.73]|eukprot:ORX94501.1 NAD(P)H:quinone oxidoreductase, type IV [Basidiobolus meristosporus CBS 931.73]
MSAQPTTKISIILYTVYGHIYELAKAIKKGLETNNGVVATIYQVPETLSDDILAKIHAPPKPDIPVITPDMLTEADGFFFGIPTRFGAMSAQFQQFWDATGALWAQGALRNKFAATFFSTGSQHGGQETTAMTFMTTVVHHGMIYIPNGFASPHLTDNSEIVGGGPWGVGTITNGDGSRMPSQKELEVAELQGQNYGEIVVRHTQPQLVERVIEKIVEKQVPSKANAVTKKSFFKKLFA